MNREYVIKPYVIKEKELFLWLAGLFTGVENILLFQNKEISIAVVLIEIAVLLYVFSRGSITLYLALYLIFMSLCVEFGAIVGTEDFYNLKNIRIAGLNLGIWLLLPVWITFIKKQAQTRKIKSEYPILWKFICLFGAMNAMAAVMGLLMKVMNDNGVGAMGTIMSVYLADAYSYLFLPVSLMIGICIILTCEKDKLPLIECAIKAALFASVFQLFCSYIFNVKGVVYGYDSLLSSASNVFMPFLVLFMQHSRTRVQKILIAVISFSGTYLGIRYSSSGKFLITLFICLALLFFTEKKGARTKLVIFFAIVIMGIFFAFIISKISRINGILSIKLSQTVGLLKFWDKDWLTHMGMSPRIRIEEMYNVIMEYMHKPVYFLTGKGYGGTARDYGGYILSIPETARGGTFSEVEYLHNAFYSLHEFTKPLLVFGLMEIILAGRLIALTIRQIKNNLWLLIGTYWYLLFYGYSFTISTIGILCLLIGLGKAEEYQKGKKWRMIKEKYY